MAEPVQLNPVRMVRVYTEDITPLWKLTIQKIVEVVITLLVPFAAVLAAYAILPASILPYAIPIIGIGATFSAAFLFAPRNLPTELVPYDQIFPPEPPPIALTPETPRGLRNAGNNCWINSLFQQVLRDKKRSEWIMNTPADLATVLKPALTLPLDFFFPNDQIPPIPNRPLQPVLRTALPPLQNYQTRQELAARIKVKSTDKQIRLADLTPEQIAALGDKKEIELTALTHAQHETMRKPGEIKLTDLSVAQRAALRQAENANLMAYARSIPDVMGEGALDLEPFRQFLERQQLTEEEMLQIVNQIDDFCRAVQFLQLIRNSNTAVHIPIELFNQPEGPWNLPEEFFAHFPADQRQAHLDQAQDILRLYHLLPAAEKAYVLDAVKAFQAIQKMPQDERLNCLRYLHLLHGKEVKERERGVRALLNFRQANQQYDAAVNAGERVARGNTQLLRQSIHAMTDLISGNAGRQEDPTEAFPSLDDLLPEELRTKIELRKVLKGLDGPEGIRKGTTILPFIPLELKGVNPNVTALMENFASKPADGDEPMKVNGVDYQIEREEAQLVHAPSSLWIVLKRFTNQAPFSFLHAIFPCCFGPPELEMVKIKNPVILPDFLEFDTIEDGHARYELDSFIVHLGGYGGGHYVCYTRNLKADGTFVWHKLDDARVTIVEGGELEKAKEQAYVPHYSKIEE